MKTNNERGIALITALFVMFLAVVASYAIADIFNIGVRRATNFSESETEWWYARGVESWVESILVRDAKLNPNTVGFNGLWAQPVDFLPIDNGGIRGRVEDLQGRFNLNNLGGTLGPPSQTNPQGAALAMQQFERLLDNLPNFDASQYHGVGAAIRDWVDGDSERSGTNGAEDEDYLALDPPYRAANRLMGSPSELMLVKGMTKELYAALQPYVCALPSTNAQVNVNTASEPVLLAMAPPANIDKSGLEAFIKTRVGSPATSINDLVVNNGTTGGTPAPQAGAKSRFLIVNPGNLAVTSSYFELQAEIVVGSGRLALYSVIYRPAGSAAPVVVAHSTNTE